MTSGTKNSKKKLYLLLLLLLIGVIAFAFSGTVLGITLQDALGNRQVERSTWNSATSSSGDVIEDVIGFLVDIGIPLTIVPDMDYGHDYECFEMNMIMFEECCDRCDPITLDCVTMCTPARALIVDDIPADDVVDEDCYNDCMIDTGCEFTESRADIELLCNTACIDYIFYGYETEPECVTSCTDYYIVNGIDSTPSVALNCDYVLDTNLFECRFESETETYVWDGTPVTDINAFYENGYPLFYSDSKSQCQNWFRDGIWIDTSEKVGCTDFRFFADSGCRLESVLSAKDVCETIGGTFICVEDDISCNL